MKKIFFAALLFPVFFAAGATETNLLKNGDFSRYKVNWVTNGKVTEEGKTGVLTLSGKANRAFSRQVIDVDPSRESLRLTADISADKPVQVLVGFIPAGKDWKEINYRNSGTVAGTFTRLAEPLNRNSSTAVLEKTVKLRKGQYLALGAKEDQSDLPNYSLERIKSFSAENGKTVLKFYKPVRKSYPAGTCVRIHKDGPTYVYTSSLRKGFPGKLRADGTAGSSSSIKFPAGTAGVKACLLIVPLKSAKDVRVQFRNVKIVKISK